jgi:membrane-bound metal-dependent hydrolase YbcI (DUF457 family)
VRNLPDEMIPARVLRIFDMANFRTHVTVSSLCGVGIAALGAVTLDLPPESCILAGGLCGLAGMLPDLDSDSSVPVRETMAFAAAVVPMLMIDRFQAMGWSHETIVLAGGLLYCGVRFGVSALIKRYTVHRGMWHSLPAAAIFGLLAFLICSCEDMTLRLFKTGAVVLGYMVHLILDAAMRPLGPRATASPPPPPASLTLTTLKTIGGAGVTHCHA